MAAGICSLYYRANIYTSQFLSRCVTEWGKPVRNVRWVVGNHGLLVRRQRLFWRDTERLGDWLQGAG